LDRRKERRVAVAPRRVQGMTGARILSFEHGARARRLQTELDGWRARLRMAYEREWDWRAREICKIEIRRLSDLSRSLSRDVA